MQLQEIDYHRDSLLLKKVRRTGMLNVAVMIYCVLVLLYIFLKSPFSYPYFIHEFDVSGKRSPHIEDYLDMFLISGGFVDIQTHQKAIEEWKLKCTQQIDRSILKGYRRKQYERVLDDKAAFKFYFIRFQTRYRQRNYVKSAYRVKVRVGPFAYYYDDIKTRYSQLADISFECTLRAYHSKNQRKLMTRELRERIMWRDNYTCQLCGKYMPDEVGLHIDHIIPIAKGGKTVASNLRVLCSKCNGSKSDKM